MRHVFTGFGFGPIQSGLFVREAFFSGHFDRLIVAEIDQQLVDAVRAAKGTYFINVAKKDRVIVEKIEGVEIYNPTVDTDREKLLEALAESTEVCTSLPSVKFYDNGRPDGVAALLAAAIQQNPDQKRIIYTAENNNHAAEILSDGLKQKLNGQLPATVQCLNTVIGKMSGVVTDQKQIQDQQLVTMTPDFNRAFLVEQFNKILVTQCSLDHFQPGIDVFLEKQDLLPFEEAKLYGHNAIHALLAYLGAYKGYNVMTELKEDVGMMKIARDAFLNESGAALIQKYVELGDPLFTPDGYREYAEDLLDRMTNPFLTDTIERAGRDPVRKLGLDDRVCGTMKLALEYGIMPEKMALGGLAGICFLLKHPEQNHLPKTLCFDPKSLNRDTVGQILDWIWGGNRTEYSDKIASLIADSAKDIRTQID